MEKTALHLTNSDISTDDLSDIGAADPRNAVATWHRILDGARAELDSGHRAATAVEVATSQPIDRARFLVLRDALARDWKPRGAVEAQLVESLAQAMTMRERALRTLVDRETSDATEDRREYEEEWAKNKDRYLRWGSWMRPRVSTREARDIAKADVERWDRVVTRTIRTLQNLRRYSVVINNAAQVNVGQQQVNVLAKPTDGAV